MSELERDIVDCIAQLAAAQTRVIEARGIVRALLALPTEDPRTRQADAVAVLRQELEAVVAALNG